MSGYLREILQNEKTVTTALRLDYGGLGPIWENGYTLMLTMEYESVICRMKGDISL